MQEYNELKALADAGELSYELADPATNPFFGYTPEEINEKFFGAALPEEEYNTFFWSHYKVVPEGYTANVPDYFDATEQWPQCAEQHPIRNQGQCGSCWSFGTSEAVSFRSCTLNQEIDVIMAPQQLVSCNHDAGVMGCRGAATGNAYAYFVREGIVEDSCYPYKSGSTGRDGTCYNSCTDASGEGDFDQLHCKAGSIEVIAADAGKND